MVFDRLEQTLHLLYNGVNNIESGLVCIDVEDDGTEFICRRYFSIGEERGYKLCRG